MSVFLSAFFLVATSLAIHVIVWKIRLPRRQIIGVLIIFAAVLCLWFVYAVLRGVALPILLHVALFQISAGLSYAITYSAIEADSPTLSLMHFLAEGRGNGVPAAEVLGFLSQRPFAKARLTALLASGLIRLQNDRYVLAGNGSLAFRVVLGYRRLYGPVSKGG
ncbi:MAG: hypothetical protein QOJ45_1267 [Verrucomicrobiota bacterium]|jgi:hypothetical protein